jgi:hypothetical protein
MPMYPTYKLKPSAPAKELEARLSNDHLTFVETGMRGGYSTLSVPREELPMFIRWLENQLQEG